MSRTKSLIHILGACEKHEFDKVVKTYLKEVYNYTRIVLTDGINDTGLDIKVLSNQDMIQYQLTTQKSNTNAEIRQLESKIFEDIAKAKINHTEYNFSDTLYFFYSYEMTNKTQREFVRKAKVDYGINLLIVDSKQIAEESEEYLVLQKVIYNTSGLADFQLKSSIFEKEDMNLVFDLVSFGKSSDIKLQIVESYILKSLHDNTQLSTEEIILKCVEKFNSNENTQFYEKLISKLLTTRKIELDTHTNKYALTSKEKEKILKLLEQSSIDEKQFIFEISNILSKYNQQDYIEQYVTELKTIYTNNFNSNLSEDVNESSSDSLKVSRDFTSFIEGNIEKKELARHLAIELFNICDKNKFLQKNCASKVFCEKTNIARAEQYVNAKKRVFIDTNISLYLLCYFYKPKCNFDSYYYQTATSFYEFCRKNKIKLYLPERYVWEMQTHVKEALNLIPFTLLPEFYNLGSSRNVIFNFYKFISKNNLFAGSYNSFLDNFGFRVDDNYNTHNQLLEKYIGDLGVEIYEFGFEYNIVESKTKQLMQKYLEIENKSKTPFSLNNDAIMLDFLGDNDVEVHPIDPLFVTWDRIFFRIQNEYFRINPNSQRWHLLTPSKFIDHYALLNFSIDADMFSKELVAMLSDEIIGSTHSLLDSLTYILNPNDEVGLEYTRRLAKIRDEEVFRGKEEETIPGEQEGEAIIDEIFYQLINHYKEDKIDILKKVFSKKDFVDDIVGLINNTVESYHIENKLNEANLFIKFDKIIEKIIKVELES